MLLVLVGWVVCDAEISMLIDAAVQTLNGGT